MMFGLALLGQVEVGFEFATPQLNSFSDIILENAATSSNSTTTSGSLNSPYPDVFAQTLKLELNLDQQQTQSILLKSYLPLNAIAQIDTGYIYLPEYVLYRAEMQRPRVQMAYLHRLNEQWKVGGGFDVGFSVSATANVVLQNGSGKVSDQRISARLKPTIVPQAMVEFTPVSQLGSDLKLETWIRGENASPFELQTNAGARVFSGGAGVDFQYVSRSTLFFDPWAVDLRAHWQITPEWRLIPGVSYQWWSRFPVRAAVISGDIQNNCNGNAGCSSVFSGTLSPEYEARNLWVPELAVAYRMSSLEATVGYRFKDSIFSGLPTGVGNYLDPPRHDWLLQLSLATQVGWKWILGVQHSALVEQIVVKSNATEVGGPRYVAGGSLWGGHLRLAVPF